MILINSSPKDALKIFQPFLPIFVPVGIGYLAAAAEQEGIEAHIIDEQVEEDILPLVEKYVARMKPPYIFGFSVLTAAFKSAIELSLQIRRRYPDSVICFGGIHPTATPDEILSSFPHIDVIIRGEGERALLELYRCVKNRGDYTHIKNLSFRRNAEVVHNELVVMEDISGLPPFPYHRFSSEHYDLGFIISSRGCPHSCIFCSNRITTGKRYRVRSAEVIIEEIEMLNRQYNKEQVLFLDDNLLVNKQRIRTLLEMIRERGLHRRMSFSFQARGDNVDKSLLRELFDSGFRSVFFGLETASESIMKAIKKGETVAQCIEAVRLAKEIGFHVSATFIYALPEETHGDRMDCVRLSKELRLDMVRFNNATPYPGTELYRIAKDQGRLYVQGLYENFVSVSTFIENPFRMIPFSYVPEGNTEAQIRRDILFSYFSFYLDLRLLAPVFTRPDRGVGWFNAGERLRDVLRKVPALSMLGLMMMFKLGQLFCYSVIKRETALSIGFFFRIFHDRWIRKDRDKAEA